MGLASWLVELGIHVEKGAAALATRGGGLPLCWPAGATGSLIYRLPRDPHQRASLFATAQTIVVNEGEVAVVLEDGRSQGHLEPGRYTFEKQRVVGSLDIVWVRTGQQLVRWGVGNVTSADSVQVSANGMLYVRVEDARAFNAEVVQGAVVLAEVDLQRFLISRLQGVLRATMSRFPALELQGHRDVFSSAVRSALAEPLRSLGLVMVDLEVIEVGLPAEFKAAIQEATLAQHTGRATLIQATTAAQVKQLEAQAAAQASLLAGQAQLQLMAQMQAQGLDPLRLKALEALEVMAENPAQGLLSDGARSNLFGQVALAALAGPTPGGGALGLPPAFPAAAVGGPVPPAAAPPPTRPETSAAACVPANREAELQRQLDALVERLASGAIGEETFNKLSARIEGQLAQLRGEVLD